MFERLGHQGQAILTASLREARSLHDPYVGTEHLLLGLLDEQEGVVADVFARVSLTAASIRSELGPPEPAAPSRAAGIEPPLPFTPRLRKVVEDSVRTAGAGLAGGEHLLLAMLDDAGGVGGQLLRWFGTDPVVLGRLVRDEVGEGEDPSGAPGAPLDAAG